MEVRERSALDEVKNAKARRHDGNGAQTFVKDKRVMQLRAQRAVIFVAGEALRLVVSMGRRVAVADGGGRLPLVA